MEVKNENDATQVAHEAEEHIHLPPPSWAPIILALGMAGIVFGIVLTPILLLFGIVVTVIGLGMWILDEIHNATAADSQSDGHTANHAS